MADRANTMRTGTRLFLFARSIALLALFVTGVPWLLMFVARERFGGGGPLHGVPPPADWSGSRVRDALTDRLTDQTIADIVIRLALVVGWVGVIVLVFTVAAELVHMVRHRGLARPDVRGLRPAQRPARLIAAGLVAIAPLLTSPSGAVAHGRSTPLPDRSVVAAVDDARSTESGVLRHAPDDGVAEPITAAVPAASAAEYVVQPGDSIFGIAERMAGPDSARVGALAAQLVELNLGREMPDGRRFDNAAFIDVGWVLVLPTGASAAAPGADVFDGASDGHVVQQGETLWSIAGDELGDPQRWPELFDVNEGRTFDDGHALSDPALIRPGWDLALPIDDLPPVGPPMPDDTSAGGPETDGTAADSSVQRADLPAEGSEPSTGSDGVVPLVDADVGTETDGDVDVGAGSDASSPVATSAPAATLASPRSRDVPPTPRENIWHEADSLMDNGLAAGAVDASPVDRDSSGSDTDAASASSLIAPAGAAMLSAGVLTLLAVRRRERLRRARPRAVLSEPGDRAVATERSLRSISGGERLDRVERVIRAVAPSIAGQGARIESMSIGRDGELELRATGPITLPSPWEGDDAAWRLTAVTPLEMVGVRTATTGSPCPTLVQLGTDEHGRDVYVDLEALGAIEVGGPGEHADAIVAATATTLAASQLAEVTTLVGLGVPDEAFLGHRRYVPATEISGAFDAAAAAIGSTAAMDASTFALRAEGAAGETWEPAVVLVGSAAGVVTPPSDRRGLAVVSASPVHGPSSRLAPDGDDWVLMPAGLRLRPIGLSPADVGSIAELVTVIDATPESMPSVAASPDGFPLPPGSLGDHTLVVGHDVDAGGGDDTGRAPDPRDDTHGPVLVGPDSDTDEPVVEVGGATTLPYDILVRMIGPVDVVDRAGAAVQFERSKTRELIVWLATHRDRSTRSSARTALWEIDVRDATFANVVSEARRSLARLVEPPEGEEWVGRTMTEALPLHERVLSDADVIRHALVAARMQPPTQAIATLSPAVDLVVGVPFEGTSYLWPDSEGLTSNLVLLTITATTELAAHCLSIGDIEGVFDATARGLRVLPGHEELIGLRMEAHARAGDHAGVRLEWESYERVITSDPWSDGEPAPKLVELRRRLLRPTNR